MPQLDVLIVEDDAMQREALVRHLSAQQWRVRAAADGHEALAQCQQQRPDIVVLDVQLPGRSGIEVCAALRARYQDSLGVMMLTGLGGELDIEMGFEVGADDYVVKPFRLTEIVARLKALARRMRRSNRPGGASSDGSGSGEVLLRGPLRIDLSTRRVSLGGQAIKLTATEFELLVILARRPERVFTRQQLLEGVWHTRNEAYEHNVYSHITHLRRKLEETGLEPSPIETVYGQGYRFVTPAEPVPRK